MPYAIDEDAMTSPNMQVLDIGKPPVKLIPHQEFPKMLYLHPVDKTREHRTQIVQTLREQKLAEMKGWRTDPHIPQAPPDAEIEAGEFETAPAKRSSAA